MLDQLIPNYLAMINNNLLIMLNHELIKEGHELGVITENDYKAYILETLDKVGQMKPMRLFTISNKEE